MRLVVLAIGALATLVVAVQLARPRYVASTPVVESVLRHAYVDSTAHHAPWLHTPAELAIRTPQFLADRERFARDLLRTGKVDERRAWGLADVAVKEAYRRRVPPALVLGVMLTENDELKSTARSRVGAVGLMQVHGKPWRGALGRRFGTNLKNDTTNLRYGVFILGFLAKKGALPPPAKERGKERGSKPPVSLAATAESAGADTLADQARWRSALLRYNGCVRGTNTPGCRRYPELVRRQVQRRAKATCAGRDFESCVARPLWLAMAPKRVRDSVLTGISETR